LQGDQQKWDGTNRVEGEASHLEDVGLLLALLFHAISSPPLLA